MSTIPTTSTSEPEIGKDLDAVDQILAAEHSRMDNDLLATIQANLDSQRFPTATYRVQLNLNCMFREIEATIPYLFTLGISDLYTSPFFQARPGSTHGYDVVNPGVVNPEIGTMNDVLSLRSALREHDMGWLADVVPNHMAVSPMWNPWWQDVLENGPSSAYAAYFDIDWMPLKLDLSNKVLLPVLGDQFGKVLEDGELKVRFHEGAFWLDYYDQQFPLAPRSYSLILGLRSDELRTLLEQHEDDLQEYLSILTAIQHLPEQSETEADRLIERRREKEIVKRRLNELVQRSAPIADFVNDNVRILNGTPGDPHSYDPLDELLQDQAYRLAYWRVAAEEINYRRFFDINDLAAICTELPQVFDDSHQLIFDLLDQGVLTGLRIDHPDGLYDPRGYLMALQQKRFQQLCRSAMPKTREPNPSEADAPDPQLEQEQRLLKLWQSATDIPGSPLGRPLYVVVEKILANHEPLPEDWLVHGTVGYDFLNAANGVFVSPHGERPLSSLFTRFTKSPLDFNELVYQAKRLIVHMSMSSELNVLGHRLDRISERNRWTRDFTLQSLMQALQEVIASFQVYRSYVHPDRLLDRDRRYIEQAVTWAKFRNPAMDTSIFDFVCDVLLLRFRENADDEERRNIVSFVGKFQQLTGPIMAKSVEDTTFYRFNRLVSLNEVGGEPNRFVHSVEEFHQMNLARLPRLAQSLNATSTHDTKRSEDVRARINVLSEIPKIWQEHVQRWHRGNRKFKQQVQGIESPSASAEYLLYQTLVGTWPDEIPQGAAAETYVARLQQYMRKVVREAKVHTSWVSPNEPYESAVDKFVASLFDSRRASTFLSSMHEFSQKVAEHGYWNSLSQLVLKMTSPGVPDFYQGCETWNLTLVDPDNRHPVDFVHHRERLNGLLDQMATAMGETSSQQVVESWLSFRDESYRDAGLETFLQQLLVSRRNGLMKTFTTLIGLRFRRQNPELFSRGEYIPLNLVGPQANQLLAFLRRDGQQHLLVIVPRLTVQLSEFGGPPPVGKIWDETFVEIPPACSAADFQNVLTRAKVLRKHDSNLLPVAEALHQWPLALLYHRSS